jgi:hypothetical protein
MMLALEADCNPVALAALSGQAWVMNLTAKAA